MEKPGSASYTVTYSTSIRPDGEPATVTTILMQNTTPRFCASTFYFMFYFHLWAAVALQNQLHHASGNGRGAGNLRGEARCYRPPHGLQVLQKLWRSFIEILARRLGSPLPGHEIEHGGGVRVKGPTGLDGVGPCLVGPSLLREVGTSVCVKPPAYVRQSAEPSASTYMAGKKA